MANKFHTWEQFEKEKQRLLDKMPVEMASLERILLQTAQRNASPTLTFEREAVAPHVVLIIARRGRLVDRAAVALEAQEKVYANYFSDVVDCLTSVGVSLAKERRQGVLPEPERIRLYSYFTTELVQGAGTFSASYPLARDVPLINTLLGYYFLPRLPEQVAVLKQVISELSDKRYLSRRAAKNLTTLFFPEVQVRAGNLPATDAARKDAPRQAPGPVEAPAPIFDTREAVLYLTGTLGVPAEVAASLSEKNPLDCYSHFYDSLSEVVGEEYARALVQKNTGLLELPVPSQSKYLNTVRKVLEELRAHSVRKPQLNRKLGLSTETLGMYSSLESVIELKQRVFQSTRTFVNPRGIEEPDSELDIDDYKNWLLGRAGMNVTMARALTSGNNVNFVGNNILPLRHYRANSLGKVNDPTLVDRYFDSTVAQMVRYGALIRRNSKCYSFNEKVGEVTNLYLSEYMRLTLHGDRILSQEGCLTLNPVLVKEFKR
jgi:hypothetical protein